MEGNNKASSSSLCYHVAGLPRGISSPAPRQGACTSSAGVLPVFSVVVGGVGEGVRIFDTFYIDQLKPIAGFRSSI